MHAVESGANAMVGPRISNRVKQTERGVEQFGGRRQLAHVKLLDCYRNIFEFCLSPRQLDHRSRKIGCQNLISPPRQSDGVLTRAAGQFQKPRTWSNSVTLQLFDQK